jgi:hypothetical protein
MSGSAKNQNCRFTAEPFFILAKIKLRAKIPRVGDAHIFPRKDTEGELTNSRDV